MTESSTVDSTPTPTEIARRLPGKLLKRLRACLDQPVPWSEAPKKHRQLLESRLIQQGDDGTRLWAVATPLGKLVEQLCPR